MYRKALTAVCFAVLVSPAWATPIAYDGFDSYPNGTDLSGGSAGNGSTGPNGEFGWTSDWTAVSGVNVQPAGPGGSKTAQVNGATNNIVAATRSFPQQTASAIYFSVVYRPVAGLEGSDFVHFYLANNNTTNNNSAGIGDVDTGLTNFGARIGTTNGGDTTNSTTASAEGVAYLLVGKVSKNASSNYNQIDLFINPTSSVEPAIPNASDAADSGLGSLNTFSVRTFNLDAGDVYQFDNVRIGTTFGDVVPEPSTAALLAIGGAGLLLRRRGSRCA